MKTISIFLALINSLLAGLLIAFLITGGDMRHEPSWWSLFRILIGSVVILIGLLTWLDSMFPMYPGLIALSSLSLAAIGAATVVWTFNRAQVTGDMEYHMLVYGASLFTQGLALLFGLSQSDHRTSAA